MFRISILNHVLTLSGNIQSFNQIALFLARTSYFHKMNDLAQGSIPTSDKIFAMIVKDAGPVCK